MKREHVIVFPVSEDRDGEVGDADCSFSSPALAPDEESNDGALRRESPSALSSYFRYLSHLPKRSYEEQKPLFEEYRREPSLEREHELFELNLRLVISFAKHCGVFNRTDALDLIQEGNLGLLEAVRRFDPSRGNRFSTYARFWIRQKILTVLTGGHRKSHVSCSLDQVIGDDGRTIGDLVPDEKGGDAGEHVDRTLIPANLLKVMTDALTIREQTVLSLRFGIQSGESCTLEEVGAKIGVTKERVRQIVLIALRKLRTPQRLKKLGKGFPALVPPGDGSAYREVKESPPPLPEHLHAAKLKHVLTIEKPPDTVDGALSAVARSYGISFDSLMRGGESSTPRLQWACEVAAYLLIMFCNCSRKMVDARFQCSGLCNRAVLSVLKAQTFFPQLSNEIVPLGQFLRYGMHPRRNKSPSGRHMRRGRKD